MPKEQKFSFFKNNKANAPDGSLSVEQLVEQIREGTWAKPINLLRLRRNNPTVYKQLKERLPGVTISALLKSRDVKVPIERRLIEHTGLICLDVDKKDNPKLRTQDLVDKECLVQFVSPGGEGLKIIYRCVPTRDLAIHRRIFDSVVERLKSKGVNIKVDPIVKALAGLQYVSSDPDVFYQPKTKLVVKPLPPIKRKPGKVSREQGKVIEELNEYINALGKRDITKEYEDWLHTMFGLAYTLGEAGRKPMHKICSNYPGYAKIECDEKFDACLESSIVNNIENPITIATVFKLLSDGIPKPKAKQLARKYNQTHAVAVGKGELITQGPPELMGLVRYKLFLFKPTTDKKTNEIIDLQPVKLNLNAFEILLRDLGFFRYEKLFVHIRENIVDAVDLPDILHRVTLYIEGDGDYVFMYKEVEYRFSWEDIAHRWREVRALGTTNNQVTASLQHWEPKLLKDLVDTSYVPFRNGVVVVDRKLIKLVPYHKLQYQIWRERILPREFKQARTRGMYEEFFANVMGRGANLKTRIRSPEYLRALWYYGYMLQGTKRMSTARAWLLYDIKVGNSGRSGKTIVGKAVGHIRSVAEIDGKRIDLSDRFAFQNVQPWNDVIFIDDPDKRTSIVPLFNMISGTTLADRKMIAPIVKDLKIMIASNWVLESAGTSESGRQFVSQLDDFYVKYAKDHNDTIQPIVDYHGKEFFTDWNERDWNEFDTFSINALQYHLKTRAPQNTIIGNSAQLRFMQSYEEELFFALCVALAENAKKSFTGTTIVQNILTEVIREHGPDLKKVGRIAKEFLHSLGVEPMNTTVKVAGMSRMAWVFPTPLPKLNWGKFKSQIKFSNEWN